MNQRLCYYVTNVATLRLTVVIPIIIMGKVLVVIKCINSISLGWFLFIWYANYVDKICNPFFALGLSNKSKSFPFTAFFLQTQIMHNLLKRGFLNDGNIF